MSSAALQTAPHQQQALHQQALHQQAPHQQASALASANLSSPTARYTSSHPAQSREAYNAQQHQSNLAATSTSSRRPPSRKTSGNGAAHPFDTNSPVTVRSAHPVEYHSPASERSSAMPPVAPPRTSSNQQAASSRRAGYPTEAMANSPRHAAADSPRASSRDGTNGASDSQRSRRQYQQPQDPRSAPSRDGRAAETSIPIRTQQTQQTQQSAASKSSREATENLNRAISNPEVANGHDSRSRNHASSPQDEAAPPPVVATGGAPEERRATRSRHDHSRGHKGTSKFGDFILGNTIGEGEFGKVKLGWKQDSSVQVAIKLIKRDTVGHNSSRLAKIKREVTILRGINHPNIVRLIDMVENDRYIGIILEYASGGELFDYILNHRYLKDHSARRLFSQLVSGVGYLHKKGIVHRDLKLENLLLDRNRNIIITDFGFANTFDANDDLSEEEELNLTDREHVKRMGLDRIRSNGMRKGDLMQTSCGSPCYAAPELVVSDSLYTGRKVDVWSCGVILYAMLAGYLPFDDDPANPEGDNINLLYKYIVSTPLTFPEYVTPHARDLLRRILVPNPRKRADLFEVARHSWLSEYSHVVEFITSSTTLPSDVQNSSSPPVGYAEPPMVARSSSVREAAKAKATQPAAVGGLAKAHGKIDQDAEQTHRTPKDTKRRTVQVEYVAPITQTRRGSDTGLSKIQSQPNSPRDREESRSSTSPKDKPLPRDPPVSRDAYGRPVQTTSKPPSSYMNAPPRPSRDPRAPDGAFAGNSGGRPQTGGSMQSSASMGLQTRTSYGQPAPPAVADMTAEGRIQQPSSNDGDDFMGRPSVSIPAKFAKMSGFAEGRPVEIKGHKRSSTIGEISSKLLGRSGSVFGRSKKRQEEPSEKPSKKYPPVSMSNTAIAPEQPSRPSMDSKFSRRSFSLGIGKKRSGSMTGSQGSGEKKDRRRFSLLPASFSLKAIGLGKDHNSPAPSDIGSQSDLPIQHPRLEQPRSVTAPEDARGSSPFFDRVYDNNSNHHQQDAGNSSPVHHQRYNSEQLDVRRPNAVPSYMRTSHLHSGSETSVELRRPPTEPAMGSQPYEYADSDGYDGRRATTSRGVLQKNHKRFTDAYDQADYRGHEGSSGAAKRVMDFFRRRGKARGGDDR